MSQDASAFTAQLDQALGRLRAAVLALQPTAAAGRVLDQLARAQATADSLARNDAAAILRHERDILYALGIRWLREQAFPTVTVTRDEIDEARTVVLCIDNDWDAPAWIVRDGRG